MRSNFSAVLRRFGITMNFLAGRPAALAQPMYAYLRSLAIGWLLPLAGVSAIAVAFSIHDLYEDQSSQTQRWANHVANEIDLALIRRLEGLRTLAALTGTAKRSVAMGDWAQAASSYD
ncbi:MAG: hypothetical protein WCK08_04500, partial [Betaproteobacteria bacterium]